MIKATGWYARFKLITGTLFIGFGVAIVVRSIARVGAHVEVIPALMLGAVMIGLGALRWRQAILAR